MTSTGSARLGLGGRSSRGPLAAGGTESSFDDSRDNLSGETRPSKPAVPTVTETSDPRASRFRSASSLSSTSSTSPTAWLGTVILLPRRADPLCVQFGIGFRAVQQHDHQSQVAPIPV